MPTEKRAVQRRSAVWSYASTGSYVKPFLEVDLDVEFVTPDGSIRRVLAFWAGDSK